MHAKFISNINFLFVYEYSCFKLQCELNLSFSCISIEKEIFFLKSIVCTNGSKMKTNKKI